MICRLCLEQSNNTFEIFSEHAGTETAKTIAKYFHIDVRKYVFPGVEELVIFLIYSRSNPMILFPEKFAQIAGSIYSISTAFG